MTARQPTAGHAIKTITTSNQITFKTTSRTIAHFAPEGFARVARCCTVVKANELETLVLTGVAPRDDPAGAARALRAMGCRIAIVTLAEAAQAAADLGDFGTQALATRHLGYGPLVQGDFERARDFIGRSLDLYRQAGELAGAADALIGLGIVESNLGRYDIARRHYQEAADILEELGDEQIRAVAIGDIGNVDYFTGRLEDARRLYRQATDIQRKYDDRRGMAINLNNNACIAHPSPTRTNGPHALFEPGCSRLVWRFLAVCGH